MGNVRFSGVPLLTLLTELEPEIDPSAHFLTRRRRAHLGES